MSSEIPEIGSEFSSIMRACLAREKRIRGRRKKAAKAGQSLEEYEADMRKRRKNKQQPQ